MSKYLVKVNGKSIEVEVEQLDGTPVVTHVQRQISVPPQAAQYARPAARKAAVSSPAPAAGAQSETASPAASGSGAAVTAPMPGNILDIQVKAGDTVTRGQVLLVFEAMKMENEVMAEQDGVIAEICVEKGAAINTGDVLIKYQE